MMQQRSRQTISAKRNNTSGGVALSLSLDVEVQNGFHKTWNIFTHTARFLHTLAIALGYRSSRCHKLEDINQYLLNVYTRRVQLIMMDAKISLQSGLVPHTEQSLSI